MSRNVRILVAVTVAVLAGYAVALVFAIGWLTTDRYFGASSNLIQHASGPATFAALVFGVYHYLTAKCALPWCPRLGKHPVDGTLKTVCSHHHTLALHQLVHSLHAEMHALSGKLGWGESHTTSADAPKP